MSLRRARAIAYGVVAVLAVAAIVLTNPMPARSTIPAGEILSQEHAEHILIRERHDTVARGESLVSVLARGGVSEVLAREALKAAKMLDPRRIPAGMPLMVRTLPHDSLPTEVILRLAVDRLLHLKRSDTGWTAEEERIAWRFDTVTVHAVIQTNLYSAMDAAAPDVLPKPEREELARTLADIFEYRVDMSRDLQVGDAFRVVIQRRTLPTGGGDVVKLDNIIVATAKLSGTTTEAVRFKSNRVGGDFFDANGKSLRTGFLRNPVSFRRISSGFGTRRHPILGTMRRHAGTDYAAASGTPIRAVGDGVVIKAGWGNGYGNVVEIRHPNGFVSRYGHMRGFAKGIYRGARVGIEQTIGYVGSTGMSTGPHLHFEVLVNGVQRDPRVALRNASSDPIPANERVAFAEVRGRLLTLLESPALLASAESASVKQAGSRAQ